MPTNKNSLLTMLPLFLVILIDVMGVVLVFPVLTPLILQTSSGMVSPETSVAVKDFLYGFALALFPLSMFFSTPILGDLSDKFGRKKILLLCLFITVIGYSLSGIAIIYKNLTLFLLSRSISGLAAGTQPIANAAIIDLSTKENRARNLSWVVFIASIAIIIGPLLGGITSEKRYFSGFGFETPFFISAILALINAIVLITNFQDRQILQSHQDLNLTNGFKLFLAAFKEKKFTILAAAYFGFSLGWSLYYQAITWFFMEVFHYDSGKLGLFVGFIGVSFAFATTIVSKIVLRAFNDEKMIFIVFAFLMMIANLASGVSHNEVGQWLWSILNSTCNVILYALSLSLFSCLVDEDRQGWIMGVAGSIGAITWTVGGLIAGPLGYLDIHVPLLVAGVLCFLSVIFMITYKRLNY